MRCVPLVVIALSLGFVPLASCRFEIESSGATFTSFNEAARFKAERTVDLPLSIEAGRRLAAATAHGDIVVRANSTGVASVRARLRASGNSQAEAQAVLERYSVALVETADGAKVEIKGEPLEVGSAMFTRKLAPRVDIAIAAPDGVSFDGRTGSGDVSASGALADTTLVSSYGDVSAAGIRGALTARTSSGDVTANDIAGEVEAKSSYGDVALSRIEATRISAASSSGDVTLADASARSCELKTSYGHVRVVRASGQIDASSSSGYVVGEDLEGLTIALRSGYGEVAARRVKGALTAHSSSGDIVAVGCHGALDASTSYGDVAADGVFTAVSAKSSSGDVQVNARSGSTLAGDWTLNSGYGSVALALAEGLACTLDAQTSYGSASCAFPLTVEAGYKARNGRIAGAINGGGPTVKLRSSSGDVSLKRLAN